jgi:phosphatidylglycerophosphate synthase
MVFAAIAGIALWRAGTADGWPRMALFLAGAACCQGRLLCNLFDGMVAIEGGRAGKDGPFWNEFPDRVADLFILVGAGCGVAESGVFGAELGWAAAATAILTAYVRALGQAIGAGADYAGPMAKQHRMAVVTLAALLSIFERAWFWNGQTMALGLGLIALGAAVTSARRAARLVSALKRKA